MEHFKGFFRSNWRKLLGAAIGAAIGGAVGAIPGILDAYAEKDLDKMPTLKDLADESVSPTSWPNNTGYALTSAKLNGALQMSLEFSQSAR